MAKDAAKTEKNTIKKRRTAKKRSAAKEQVATDQAGQTQQEPNSATATVQGTSAAEAKDKTLKDKKPKKNPPMLNMSGLKRATCI